MSQYDPLIRSIQISALRKFTNVPLEKEDILNVIQFKFIELIKAYDEKKGMSLPSYLKKFLNYGISSYLRTYTQNGHKVLNYYSEFLDIKAVYEDNDFIAEEKEEELIVLIENSNLSSVEEKVIKSYVIDRKTIKQISLEVDIEFKKLYYIKEVAIKKLTKVALSDI